MGAPTISGGMTYEEQKKLLDDARIADEIAFQNQRDAIKQDEADREANEQAKRDALKAEELAKIAQVQMAEEESIKESMAMEEDEEQSPAKLKVDFYKSLYSGVGSKTQQSQTQTTRPL